MEARITYSDVQYRTLGRLVVNKLPHLAKGLLSPYTQSLPKEKDFSKIQKLFIEQFCNHSGITKDEITGPLYKSAKVEVRRVFVASMVHLYCPHVYNQLPQDINLSKKGFVMELSKTLKQHEANVSTMIREVIQWEKNYPDFKEKVVNMVEKLKEVA